MFRKPSCREWIQITGSFLITLSIVCSLASNYLFGELIEPIAVGGNILGGDQQWMADRATILAWADNLFCVGILTALSGLVLQTLGLFVSEG